MFCIISFNIHFLSKLSIPKKHTGPNLFHGDADCRLCLASSEDGWGGGGGGSSEQPTHFHKFKIYFFMIYVMQMKCDDYDVFYYVSHYTDPVKTPREHRIKKNKNN